MRVGVGCTGCHGDVCLWLEREKVGVLELLLKRAVGKFLS